LGVLAHRRVEMFGGGFPNFVDQSGGAYGGSAFGGSAFQNMGATFRGAGPFAGTGVFGQENMFAGGTNFVGAPGDALGAGQAFAAGMPGFTGQVAPAPLPIAAMPVREVRSTDPSRTVYVGNLSQDVTEEWLRYFFQSCGEIRQIRIAGNAEYTTRFAFVEYGDVEQARYAVSVMDGVDVHNPQVANGPLKVSMAKAGLGAGRDGAAGDARERSTRLPEDNAGERCGRTMHVSGVGDEVSELDLVRFFGDNAGKVAAIRKAQRFAWIEFFDVAGVQQGIALDGAKILNSNLRLAMSKTPIHNAGWVHPDMRRQLGLAPGPDLPPSLPAPAPSLAALTPLAAAAFPAFAAGAFATPFQAAGLPIEALAQLGALPQAGVAAPRLGLPATLPFRLPPTAPPGPAPNDPAARGRLW